MKIIDVIVYGSFVVTSVCFAFLLREIGLSRVIAIPIGIVCGVVSVFLGLYLIAELTNRTRN